MAFPCSRFYRFLRPLSAFHTYLSFSAPVSNLVHSCTSQPQKTQSPIHNLIQCRMFMESRASHAKREYKLYKEGDEITEDTILFEGCDYNHWLITVDFPKEKELKPPPEEMVATYERICAQGLNISIEEAKKRIYACSTTTYEGFQAVMTEEESEKFKDVHGVVFVLPDSYIDPQNKEYGGDKYENGKITHRPPPIQYQRGYRSRDRYNDRSRYGQQGAPTANQQRDARNNYGPPQNWQPGPPPHQPQTYAPQVQGQGERVPMNSSSFGGGQQQNYNYPTPTPTPTWGGQGERVPMNSSSYGPRGWDANRLNQMNPSPSFPPNYNQGHQGSYYPQGQDQRSFQQRNDGDCRGYNGNFSPHNYGYRQNVNPGHGQQSYPSQAQGATPAEQKKMEQGNENHTSVGPPGTGQASF